MTATAAVRAAISASGHYPSPEDRRAALLELAEAVVNERGHARQPWTNVTQLAVPTFAAATCPNLLVAFSELLDAVIERHTFVADPDAWLADHDLPLGQRTWERWDETTEGQIQSALDVLMGARS